MARFREWLGRLWHMLRPRRTDRDLHDELRAHLALAADEARRRGASAVDANRAARIAAGGTAQALESLRDQRGLPWLRDLGQDLRYASRVLLRAPGFTTAAVVSLALGIGANVVIFSVIDAALLRPLPYKDADRLVEIALTTRTRTGADTQIMADGRHLDNVRAIGQVFEGVDAYSDSIPQAVATGFNSRLWVGAFTPSLPAFLGTAPRIGRAFTDDDVAAGDRIIISDAYWQRAYRRAPGVIGTTIALPNRTCVIVGVMPSTFRYFVGARTDAWLPTSDGVAGQIVARLRPGLTVAQAQREIDAVLSGPAAVWKPRGVEILPADWNRTGAHFSQGQTSTRTMLLSLLAAVALVLAIGCANVANLLLSRTLLRGREIAVRRALGATRLRIARQFLTEGVLLAAIGSLAAMTIAWWGIQVLPALVPADLVYSVLGVATPRLDARVLTFGCFVALLTGVLCGLAPAVRAFHADAADGRGASNPRTAGPSPRQRRASQALQAAQIAMTAVLLTGAGLLLTSLFYMVSVPAGFDAGGLGYADLTLPSRASMNDTERRAFVDEAIVRLKMVPGVQGVTVGVVPVAAYLRGGHFSPESAGAPATSTARILTFYARPDYFRLVGIPLIGGRVFGPEDTADAPRVAVISESTARRYWPGQNAVGQRFREFAGDPLHTVVGIVRDVRTTSVTTDHVEVYLPTTQQMNEPSTLIFRVAGDMAPVIPTIRSTIQTLDARVIVTRIGSVDHLFAELAPFGPARFYATFLSVFAGIAVVTAAVGIYGLLSYSVSRRTREIGVRVALGASRSHVRWLALADALGPVACGLTAGAVAALWLSRFIASQLFRVAPGDPVTVGVVVVVLLAASAAATIVPVRRATRIDPTRALRAE